MHRRVLISISYDRWNNTRDIMKKVFMSFRKRWPVLVSEIRDPELSCTDYMRFFFLSFFVWLIKFLLRFLNIRAGVCRGSHNKQYRNQVSQTKMRSYDVIYQVKGYTYYFNQMEIFQRLVPLNTKQSLSFSFRYYTHLTRKQSIWTRKTEQHRHSLRAFFFLEIPQTKVFSN